MLRRSMRWRRIFAWAGLVLALAAAHGAPGARAQASPESRRPVVEQKLKLIENLLNSPKVRDAAAGDNAEIKGLVAKARELVEAARGDLAGQEYDRAANTLDEALKAVSAVSARASRGGATLSEDARRAQNADLTEQIRTYRGSLAEAAKLDKAAQDALGRLDRVTAEAAEMTRAGRHADANRLLAEAYKLAVTSVSQSRAGQTVVMSLKFETPADEFAYEQRRNQSQAMLVDMMVSEGRAQGSLKDAVNRQTTESRKLRERAESEAKTGDYKSAIKSMEQATGELTRALQTMGLPVF